jgi:pyruvate dehydrogenase E2 component (dihydrolipoamide acetyltransferase)
MPIEITMPALSPTMEEGNLAKWHVKEGDSVEAGDVIAEIETDKATMEVEAVDEGTIARIVVSEGTEAVKVNAVIAILAEEGEDVSDAAGQSAGKDAADNDTADDSQDNKAEKASNKPPADSASAKKDAPAKDQLADTPKAGPAPKKDGERIFASPLARRIAKQNGVDLTSVSGSGPHGRIVKADVEGQSGAPKTAAKQDGASPMPAPGMSDDKVLAFFEEDRYELKPHNNMRRTIASRLTESSQSIPAYYLSMDCELDVLLRLRADINDAAPIGEDEKPAYKVSVNDFIIKAMAMALRDVPMANASWTSEARILHKHSDVGVAVAIEDGLITPIIREAEGKTLSAISLEMKDLAARAREMKLKPHEYQGGSTAVSNLGMFGVSNFTSIINPPQASIVSIGAGEKKPVVRDGELVAATVMTATFAFDHRVIDGAVGAELAGAFKNYIQKPMGMLV